MSLYRAESEVPIITHSLPICLGLFQAIYQYKRIFPSFSTNSLCPSLSLSIQFLSCLSISHFFQSLQLSLLRVYFFLLVPPHVFPTHSGSVWPTRLSEIEIGIINLYFKSSIPPYLYLSHFHAVIVFALYHSFPSLSLPPSLALRKYRCEKDRVRRLFKWARQ